MRLSHSVTGRSAIAAVGCLTLASILHADALSIGGFTVDRGGALAIADGDGDGLDTLRESISAAYPGTTFSGADVLTPEYLSGIRILFLSSAKYGNNAITPLDADEIAAVRAFIARGGSAMLVADNSTFAGRASDPANQSVLAPVGIHCSGTGEGWPQMVTVLNPALSPVTSGPFGEVSSWSVGWSGWFDFVPANGAVLGTVDQSGLPGLVVFPRHALAACSGAVVALSDTTALVDGYLTPISPNNTLLLNVMAYFSAQSCLGGQCGDINADGTVDGADLGFLLGTWGSSNPAADLDASGTVDGADLGSLLGNWGPCAG